MTEWKPNEWKPIRVRDIDKLYEINQAGAIRYKPLNIIVYTADYKGPIRLPYVCNENKLRYLEYRWKEYMVYCV